MSRWLLAIFKIPCMYGGLKGGREMTPAKLEGFSVLEVPSQIRIAGKDFF